MLKNQPSINKINKYLINDSLKKRVSLQIKKKDIKTHQSSQIRLLKAELLKKRNLLKNVRPKNRPPKKRKVKS